MYIYVLYCGRTRVPYKPHILFKQELFVLKGMSSEMGLAGSGVNMWVSLKTGRRNFQLICPIPSHVSGPLSFGPISYKILNSDTSVSSNRTKTR
jgi:hypothetical protein